MALPLWTEGPAAPDETSQGRLVEDDETPEPPQKSTPRTVCFVSLEALTDPSVQISTSALGRPDRASREAVRLAAASSVFLIGSLALKLTAGSGDHGGNGFPSKRSLVRRLVPAMRVSHRNSVASFPPQIEDAESRSHSEPPSLRIRPSMSLAVCTFTTTAKGGILASLWIANLDVLGCSPRT